MNIHEVIISGKPFSNPDMIGAWMVVDNQMVHRDHIDDFKDMKWIRENCLSSETSRRKSELYWMDVSDLMRVDWYVITLS